MKTKDTEWSERWSTPARHYGRPCTRLQTVCLLSLSGTSIISLTCNARTEHTSARLERRVMCTMRLSRCLVPLHLPQATLQISVFRPVPITPRQLFSDIMRSIHFTLCEDQLPKTRFL